VNRMGLEIGRWAAVASLSLRGTLRGLRLVGLAAFASAPALIELAVVSARPGPAALARTAESLFASLTLPIVALLIVLVVAVGLFRAEIDAETLLYLSDRSVGRPTIVLGKFAGGLAATLLLTVPAALLPLGVAVLAGAPAFPIAVPTALLLASLLGAIAYGAFFLFLGLITRSALLLGLIYGILWEELLSVLPGDAPRLTVVYYLRSILSEVVTSGPLGGFSTSIPLALVVAVPLSFGVVILVLASVVFSMVETAPERESA
jgi:ABC-2 type transport system permease protein